MKVMENVKTPTKKYVKYVAYSLSVLAGLLLLVFGVNDVRNSTPVDLEDGTRFIINEAEVGPAQDPKEPQ